MTTCESLQARTETWSAPFTHVLAELSLPVTSEVPLTPGAEVSQGADPAAVLGSPSIYHGTPLLPLFLLASSFPELPANPIRFLPWHPQAASWDDVPSPVAASLVSPSFSSGPQSV